jgi:hypothetical protein
MKSIPALLSMRPAMLTSELDLFLSIICCSKNYVEFGAGGSTACAVHLVRDSIISVDSSQEWLEKIRLYCDKQQVSVKPVLIFADIGPTKELGHPRDETNRNQWPAYYKSVWATKGATDADTYLVDGRFRVASFLQVMLRASSRAIVLIHDFANRPEYHAVYDFAREIARADNLSVFQRSHDFDPEKAAACLVQFAFDPR